MERRFVGQVLEVGGSGAGEAGRRGLKRAHSRAEGQRRRAGLFSSPVLLLA